MKNMADFGRATSGPLSFPRIPEKRIVFDFAFFEKKSRKAYEKSGQKSTIDKKLAYYRTLTSEEFPRAARRKPIEHLKPGKTISCPKQFMRDREPLYHFRITQRIRCLGYQQQNIFFIIVVDLDHSYT